MSFQMILIAVTFVSAFLVFKFLTKGPDQRKNLPGGSLGLPVIGETLSFLRSLKAGRGPEWLNERISKHGMVFKTSLMGSPTVVLTGQAGNKFLFGSNEDVFAAKQPISVSTIAGKNNILELTGSRYKLVKGAIMSFLKPESLQNYIKQMDGLVKTLLQREIQNKDTIKAVVFMRKLTFNIACTILFSIEDEVFKEALLDDFIITFKAMWSLPLNFPGTVFWKGLRARSRIVNRIRPIVRKRKEELSLGILSPTSDVISCMLGLRDENQEPITEDEITDNFVTLMIGSHDTSSILLSLMIWKLARDPEIYQKVLQEQIDIKRKREEGAEGKLTWVEIQKMKYTWQVAEELMRIIPPVFGNFRKALKDTSFGGYDIPKGWQVFWAAYGTHMKEDIFDNPKEFDPSRFDNPSKPIPPFAYIPFGGGVRMCIGKEFARVETLVIIHNLVTMYEWSQVHPDEVITRQPMPFPSMGLPIKINPRNASS